MMAIPNHSTPKPSDRSRLPTIVALATGAAVAVGAATLSPILVAWGVWTSRLAVRVYVDGPPIGMSARVVLSAAAGCVSAAIVWSTLYLIVGPGGPLETGRRREDVPPGIEPIYSQTGALSRTMSLVETVMPPTVHPVVRPLPRDLDQPLSAFDPAAMPRRPRTPIRLVAPLSMRPITRIETFALEPVTTAGSKPAAAPSHTVELLVRGLESGVARRTSVG